jgi:hypothetical protein
MEWVLEFIGVFTRPGISVEDQTNLIDDLARPLISLEKIVQTERAPRTHLSLEDLRYVRETADLSHEARAAAWDNRTPKPSSLLAAPMWKCIETRTSLRTGASP